MPKGPQLRIALLGPPSIDVDGRALEVDTRKATALLAYLAFTGRPARRDSLAGLLWPETNPDRARSTLRRTLSTLKSALDARFIDIGRDTVALSGAGVWVDVDELRNLVAATERHGHAANETCSRCLEPLQRAAALDRGSFLAGFGLRDSAAFDDWQQLAGDEAHRELASVLDRLAGALAAAGNPKQAIACARRRLALDPLHEPAHRQLIGLLAEVGDRQAAMEQYRDCVRILDRELGVRPLDETTALYHAIVEGSLIAPSRPPVVAFKSVAADATYDLVGRDDELRELIQTYDNLGADGRVVALVGEAGIGKTRLADELLAHVTARGRMALAVRCYEEERGLAYGVVLELVRGAAAVAPPFDDDAWWVAEVARLAPELGAPAAQPLDSEAAQVRFYEAVAELLQHSAGPEPAMLCVDDAHWADESSLALLAYLAHRLRGRALLLAASWRPEEVVQDHPVRRLVADAQRTGRASVIEIGRLSGEDVAQLVTSTGRSDALGERLYVESGGLPFFVVEYLDSLARGDDEPDWALPVGVRDLLERRLAGLGELSLQVLAAAAVLGRAFDPDTVRAASGRTDEEVVISLEELVACGLLVEGADGALDFRHEQARELVGSRMTLARRRLLHRRAAGELDGRGTRESRAAMAAFHLAAAGDDAAAAERYRVAGDHARRLYANAEALGHYRASLALGLVDAAGLHEAIGDLETLAGNYGAAFASYETAAALAEPGLLPEIERRIGLLHLRRGEWELAEASLAAASEGLEPASRSLATGDRALVAYRMGDVAAAHELAVSALALAEETDEPGALAQAHNIFGMLAGSRGDTDEAVVHLELGASIAHAAGDAGAEAAALNNLALAVRASGEPDRAIELTTAALDLCVIQGDRHREAALRNNLADLLRDTGRQDEAMGELKHAVVLFAEIGEEGRLEPEIWKLTGW
jgi:DNA-binding SARP family transcriptional activator